MHACQDVPTYEYSSRVDICNPLGFRWLIFFGIEIFQTLVWCDREDVSYILTVVHGIEKVQEL